MSIEEFKTRILDFKSNSRKKNAYKYADMEEIINADRHHNGTKIEYLERRERLRRVLESRKAKVANDQKIVQSATASKANINEINNDAKKAK